MILICDLKLLVACKMWTHSYHLILYAVGLHKNGASAMHIVKKIWEDKAT